MHLIFDLAILYNGIIGATCVNKTIDIESDSQVTGEATDLADSTSFASKPIH